MGGIACGITVTRGETPKPLIIGVFSIALILVIFIRVLEMKTGVDFVDFLFDTNFGLLLVIFYAICLHWFENIYYESKNTTETSASYEITVNEKSFKISDFKTKVDGSIEFTTDDGTTIHASNYEIRKLDQKTDKNLGDGKDAGRKTQ